MENPVVDPAEVAVFNSRDVKLTEDTQASELSGQKNHDEDIRTKITQLESLGCGVIGSVRTVCYGTWKGDPACLISLNFNFRSGTSALRLKSAEICVSFQKDFKEKMTTGRAEPVLRNFSPRKIFGIPHTETKDFKYEIGLQCNIPTGPISVTPSSTIGRTSTYEKEHRLQISGQPWSSRKRQQPHQVLWTIREAGKTAYGIPDELNLGMVVTYSGPFQAAVEVTAKLGMGLPVSTPPWSKDDPLLFNTATCKGNPLRVLAFDELTNEDWKSIVPFLEEWEDVLVAS